jgi:hypothetical protein
MYVVPSGALDVDDDPSSASWQQFRRAPLDEIKRRLGASETGAAPVHVRIDGPLHNRDCKRVCMGAGPSILTCTGAAVLTTVHTEYGVNNCEMPASSP